MPIAVDIDDSGLKQAQAQLQAAPSRIEQRVLGRVGRAQRELLRVARSVVHVKTGRLRDSLSIDGVALIGGGTLEGAIKTNVPYAEAEVARGGEHDYAQRTLEEGAGVLDELLKDLEDIYVTELGAGRS